MSPNQILHRAGRWLLAAALAMAGVQAQAAIVGASGTLSAGTRSFDMFAGEGYPSMADGVQVYSWGYGASTASGGSGLMQISGPTLLVNQGETVSISFTNNLPTRSSMLFPGQVGVTASGGSAGVLAQEAAPGQTVTYTFIAGQPGTYLYQSGSQPGLQVEMGMVGALIVYPSGNPAGSKWAYNHIGTAYDRETLFVVGDIDSDIHAAIDEQVRAFKALPGYSATSEGLFTADLSKRFPKYWTLNGRTSPDVFAKNFSAELPHQPYNTLPRLHPGEKMLLRMIGAGTDLHPMHHHGNNSWAIARDGRMLGSTPAAGPNLAFSDYTIKVVPGQTLDALWSWTGAGLGWDVYGKLCNPAQANPAAADYCTHTAQQRHQLASDIGKPIPVKLPSEFELAYGEFYSGSPYLGDFGIRPVGAGAANTSGGYFHMFHSHNEREVVNGGIFPGGMMTMLVIEPHGVTIDVGQP
ncbi:MAG TPA: multicopper oxidase domain-containing protein [Piscinibacter sp.]|jgi:FtsP/CotA-like multicopper oxidase with cupredoxin domain|uniref:multicopper oxidase domain-containing protein n=1 Tax=Piscinibacter sp. TaxID=1903157 RepID=UPI001B71673F|nr:multicopper oxidase domain-containing protein [Piscinibacter sp.]MBK7532413.1 multicopper oxidase domain-containing protein [Piscinibacter sp.]MBP6543085.1 multicopper oxidase domain-containing protein [Piscinibacter sp.]HOY34433.1 multicopper oxidase domain-containing protein [Piscinibacter sp.]HPG77190.1 multicopper oxidase domain-containing protein [Piscinibacter sp.]HPM64769.1 multicopper oxidase domain-containing protein [Piscinibacter sp.]